MSKFGSTGGNAQPLPIFADPGSVFRRGQGGVLPERGSRAQYDMVNALLQSGVSSAQGSGSPLLALLAPMIGGAVGARTEGLYSDAQSDRDSAAIDTLLAAMGNNGQALSPPAPATPETIRNAAMGAHGGPTNAAADAWLRYANQGAARNDPLSDRLVNAMSFLPEMGVTMEVFSGGQENNSTNGLGSTRHNHGNAGDVFFYKDGRRLDWANPDDLPIFQEIVRRGKANGLTGFGAGPDYMQQGSMHLGFGDPAVWGAEGKGVNAPGWLRAAYEGTPLAMSPAVSPSSAAGVSQQDLRTLIQLMNDSQVSEPIRELAGTMVTRGMTPPDRPTALDNARLQRAQVGLQNDLLSLRQAMQPPGQFRVATPEEAAAYGVVAGQIGPDGRFYPSTTDNTSGNAGILRQQNEATTIISEAITQLETREGLSRQEALKQIARDPIYGPQLQILNINPADIERLQVIKQAGNDVAGTQSGGILQRLFGGGRQDAPPPPPGFTEGF